MWFLDAVAQRRFAWDPEAEKKIGPPPARPPPSRSRWYKTEFPAKLNAVRTMPPADMLKVVDFFGMFKWPAVSYLGFGNNHSVHHRGQLATYLRAMGGRCRPFTAAAPTSRCRDRIRP